MRTLLADLRYALRTLRKTPGFTLVAILSLALGVGANTAMFSFVDMVILRPLPVHDPQSIVAIRSTAPGTRLGDISYADYKDFRDNTHTLSSVVCYRAVSAGISATREALPKMTLAYLVSGNFFSGLGIEVPVGRGFREDEDRIPGKDLVAVISHAMWERDFHSDPNIAGRTLRLNGTEFTIVGVVSKQFAGPESFVLPDIYVPMNAYPQAVAGAKDDFLTKRQSHDTSVYGRLKPGVSLKSAQAELKTIASSLAAQYPESNRDRSVTVLTYRQDRFERDDVDAILSLILLGITGLVLLIACANVANLVLSRGAARVKEIAIRMAVGASRGALVRQLLTESIVLAVLGGVAGLAVGYAGIQFLSSIQMPTDYPIGFDLRMDSRLLTFGFAISIATGMLFGLLPALRSTRTDLSSTIKASDQGPTRVQFWRGRLAGRNLLVVAQLALSVVLLVASGLLVRGFIAARNLDPGFRIDHTLMVKFDPRLVHYDEQKTRQFYKALVDRVRTLPGVIDASLMQDYPYGTDKNFRAVIVDGYQPKAGESNPFVPSVAADDHYFPVMETKIVRGRAIDSRDTASTPRVAIVNEEFVRRYFPHRDALGAQVRLDKPDGPLVQIVGITKTGICFYWAEPPTPFFWVPFSQEYSSMMTLMVRTAGEPTALSDQIRTAVRMVDSEMPIFGMRSMQAFYDGRAMLGPRLMMQIVGAVGLMGLLLAIIGLYGVVAYAVSRRTREIGIRLAVGAKPADVLRMVLGQGLAFTMIGGTIGVVVAFFASRVLTQFITGVSTHDPAIFFSVPIILALVMLGATWLPARRAARVDPTLALRQE